nr:hypothetical protein [Bartonella grahamii]
MQGLLPHWGLANNNDGAVLHKRKDGVLNAFTVTAFIGAFTKWIWVL